MRILIFLEAFSWSSGSGQSGQLVQDRVAPRVRVEQPGMHLHDQRHGEIFPVWFLDHPSTCLHVLVHVWIDEHEVRPSLLISGMEGVAVAVVQKPRMRK